MSTEEKKKWVEIGTRAEEEFVKNSMELFGLDTCINPEKTANKYAADLLLPHGRKGDLKTVRTPFYLSKRYGYDPSLTVTMNHKDYIRYLSKNLVKLDYFYILFWCKWPRVSTTVHMPPPLTGFGVLISTRLTGLLPPEFPNAITTRIVNACS